MKYHIWNHVVTNIYFILEILQSTTLCKDDSFAHFCHSLKQLHEEGLSNKELPHMLSTCWLLFLHSAVQLIPNHLNRLSHRCR